MAWQYLPRARLIAGDSLGALFAPATQIVGGAASGAAVQPRRYRNVGDHGRPRDDGRRAAHASRRLDLHADARAPRLSAVGRSAARDSSGRRRRHRRPREVQLALAFSLGGIAAAVRFRNTLDDSKDAVYVFLAIGIGIAAAVDLPVAMVISIMFNIVAVAMWFTDFGRTPVALDGRLGERRLERARELARTGTFVARIDDEVLKEMTAEQLEGVAKRAWMRAREHDPEGMQRQAAAGVAHRGADAGRRRAFVRSSKRSWPKRPNGGRPMLLRLRDDGLTVIEYLVLPKKSTSPDELLSQLRACGGVDPVEAEIH